MNLLDEEAIVKMKLEQIKCTRNANTQTSNIIIEDYFGHIRVNVNVCFSITLLSKLCTVKTFVKDENKHKMKVTKYTLLNENQVFIEIIDYGATVISCWVPNSQGELEDVLLGFDSIDGSWSLTVVLFYAD